MATVLLVRHGRTTANTAGVLAGWTAGVELDDDGRRQAAVLGQRLAGLSLAAVVTSPLERCRQTAAALTGPPPEVDDRLGECRYGDWTGRTLAELAEDPLWRVVQAHPSAVTFPGGESLLGMQLRAIAAVREHDARVEATHGPSGVWAAVSHGDVIKAVLADALGMHLDAFQRLVVEPGSVSVIRYTALRPFVVRLNDAGTDPLRLAPRHLPGPAEASDAAVGGETGSAPDGAPAGDGAPVAGEVNAPVTAKA